MGLSRKEVQTATKNKNGTDQEPRRNMPVPFFLKKNLENNAHLVTIGGDSQQKKKKQFEGNVTKSGKAGHVND